MKVASCGVLLVLCALLAQHSVVEGVMSRYSNYNKLKRSVDDNFDDEADADYGIASALRQIPLKKIMGGIKGGIAGYKGHSMDDDFYDEADADYNLLQRFKGINFPALISRGKPAIQALRGFSTNDDFYDEADADYNIFKKLKGLNFNDMLNKGKTALQQLRGRSVDDDFYDEADADYGLGGALKVLSKVPYKQILKGGQAAVKGGSAIYNQVQARRGHSVDDDFYDEADADYNLLSNLRGINLKELLTKGKAALQQLRGRSVDDDFYDEADADYGMLSRLGGAVARAGQMGRAAYGY